MGLRRKLCKAFAAGFVLLVAIPLLPPSSADPGVLVWDLSGSPYHITGTYTTPSGSHFVIEDGVQVLMGPGAVLHSAGTIDVRGGTLGVTFTSDGAHYPGYWGILLLGGGGTVRGARFDSASRAIHSLGPLAVSDSTFEGNGMGVYAQLARADLERVVARGGSVGFYWDHAPGSITDADISGATWGVYLYAPNSDVAVTRVNVHDMKTDSYGVTTINNRPVIRESVLAARISVFL
ncbi:MAG TPA: hypothetical protein VI893_06190, partial [Thermoplasmata archaeon]|nr:hypothetical protein [Thermoplasmata archaeon]